MSVRFAGGFLLAASLAVSFAAATLSEEKKAIHALNRLAFGPRPGELDAVQKMGVRNWIKQQLDPYVIPESAELEARLKPLTTLGMSPAQMSLEYPPRQIIERLAQGRLALPKDSEERAKIAALIDSYRRRREAQEMNGGEGPREPGPGSRMLLSLPTERRRETLARVAPMQVVQHDLLEQKLYRAVYSNRQLAEVLADFWFNHFNVFLDKGAVRYLTTSFERDAIRPHVLGKFRDLLLATAEHPAMLFYLDNWRSVAPSHARGSRGLNENYARELLELHTMGVNGGYTQADVVEIARCFTGWTIAEPFRKAEYFFDERVHDNAEKTVLGVRIAAGGGRNDGLKVLEMLSRHPSTARFLSLKLAQRFVADDPPESLVKAMASTFEKTDGDLKAVINTMVASREFWSEAAYQAKIKSPFELVVSALRAAGAEVKSALPLALRVGELGQPLYRKQEPTGYSNVGKQWVNSAALLGRMNFALDLTRNKLPGVFVEVAQFRAPALSADTKASIGNSNDPSTAAGLILGSPEFQRR